MTDPFVEAGSDWAEVASVVLGTLAALAVIVAWLFAKEDAKRKQNALDRYKEDAKVEVEAARAVSEEAKKDAAKSNELAAAANERAARSENEAATAKLELAKLKAPRGFSPKQHKAMRLALETTPKGRVLLLADSYDTGAQIFARDILLVLREAKFEVVPAQVGGTQNPGVFFMRRKSAPVPPHWQSLGRCWPKTVCPT